jgi:formylmethanofuran dehydrogenase subunit B
MRIHGNTITDADLNEAAVKAGVDLERRTRHGSKSRDHAYDVILSGSNTRWANPGSSSRRNYFKAATWDEWGWFLAHLFEVDPRLTVPRVYADAWDFHRKTGGKYIAD